MTALGGDAHAAALYAFGRKHLNARAILIISAHWQVSRPLRVTAWDGMPILYDFSGFPDELYRIQYPAPGDPGLAARISSTLRAEDQDTTFDTIRGLDHGAWVPARLAWPEGTLPVLQLSFPFNTPHELFQMGRALRPLRDEGILIAGTGGIVHNLSRVRMADKNAPVDFWAAEFDTWVAEQVAARQLEKLFDYRRTAPHARLSVPTTEHFDPLFITLGAAWPDDPLETIYEGFQHGNLSMRSFSLG
ncbi:MAG: Extradiol ring-cleavage dioxygenase, class enzyme subunit [Candidatus Solibacter sp.]|nr:Extradiol ring-cleavage dioxygenase, class enzyme subunit [Candidatus Solibacter sp.]